MNFNDLLTGDRKQDSLVTSLSKNIQMLQDDTPKGLHIVAGVSGKAAATLGNHWLEMGRTLKGFHNMKAHDFPVNLRLCNPFRVGLESLFSTQGALTLFATLGYDV